LEKPSIWIVEKDIVKYFSILRGFCEHGDEYFRYIIALNIMTSRIIIKFSRSVVVVVVAVVQIVVAAAVGLGVI
jgi:hypothetical protein